MTLTGGGVQGVVDVIGHPSSKTPIISAVLKGRGGQKKSPALLGLGGGGWGGGGGKVGGVGDTLKMLRRGMVPWEKRCTKRVSRSLLM